MHFLSINNLLTIQHLLMKNYNLFNIIKINRGNLSNPNPLHTKTLRVQVEYETRIFMQLIKGLNLLIF